jgi:hypothetical protein
VKFCNGKREVKEMQSEKEYKTGLSTTVTIPTICKLDDFAKILNSGRADVVRKIIEYFIEHNDVEDLQA